MCQVCFTSFMKKHFWYHTVLNIAIIAYVMFGLFVPAYAAEKKCFLDVNAPYKVANSAAIYFVTPSCTKQVFVNSEAFFQKFTSWKQVRKISQLSLKRIQNDKQFTLLVDKSANGEQSQPHGAEYSFARVDTSSLDVVYAQAPSQADIDSIMADFNINWVDNKETGEKWPSGFDFNQSSSAPSKTVIISRLNVLKHQTFSEPLPFTNLTAYDYVKKFTKNITINLNCVYNSEGGNSLNLNASAGSWFWLTSGTCKATSMLAPYVDELQLLIHETRHSEPGDPGHTSCGIPGGNDQSLENGSGYSTAAMYLMWVYKYGINDSPAAKQQAKEEAVSLLKERFCTKPTHSNPKVQAIIDELLNNKSDTSLPVSAPERAETKTSNSSPVDTQGKLSIHFVNALTNRSIPGVQLVVSHSSQQFFADYDGRVAIPRTLSEVYVPYGVGYESKTLLLKDYQTSQNIDVALQPEAAPGGAQTTYLTGTGTPNSDGVTTVTGKVLDEQGNGIPNTAVVFAQSSISTKTDSNGSFVLSLPAESRAYKMYFPSQTPIRYFQVDVYKGCTNALGVIRLGR